MAPIEIATAGWYNLFYVIGVVAAAGMMRVAGRRNGWDPGTWAFVIIAWVAGGVIGALVPRLLLGELAAARTCLGAIAGATVALTLTARFLRLPVSRALDATAVAIPIGGVIVRVGCFLAECCQGTVTSLPIGIALHAEDLPRHPVQLYEATLGAMLAIVIGRRYRPGARPGDAFLASMGSIGAIRFVLEFVRDNDKLGPLSLAQWVVLPIAVVCFAMLLAPRRAPRMARYTPTPVNTRVIVAIGAMGAIAFAISRRLPDLEANVILAGVAALIVILAQRARAAAPTGLAVLALQIPAISTDSTFPRIYTSVGGGFNAGGFDYRHQAGTCDGPTEDWTRHHDFRGGSFELGSRRQNSQTNGVGIRALGYLGQDDVGRAVVALGSPSKPGPYTRHSAGVTIVGDVDWKYLGFSLGASGGQFYPMDATLGGYSYQDPEPPLSSYPAFGIRIGKLAGASVEARFADEVPSWAPGPLATIAVGAGDAKGNRIRIGASEAGLFLAGRRVTSNGLEILPSATFGSGDGGLQSAYQGGVMIRKWFRIERRPQGGPR